MNVEFQEAAAYIGELVAAAMHDQKMANPEDIGLNGMPILGWRAAYAEGCRDMANGIVSKIAEDQRKEIQHLVESVFNAETDRLNTLGEGMTDG